MNPTAILRLLAIFNNSQLLNLIVYPFQEVYSNWKNLFKRTYPIRSSIRALISTSGFIIGPILTQIVQWGWLTDISSYLYKAIPIFNMLPISVGTAIGSSYICGYFFAWSAKQITNLFNASLEGDLQKYINGSIEHYLTSTKAQEITSLMNAAGFNININQVIEIFNNISSLAGLDPKNPILTTMLDAMRQGDFQTIIDKAVLLEREIELINKKTNVLKSFYLPITPIDYAHPNSPDNNTNSLDLLNASTSREEMVIYTNLRPEAIMFQYKRKNTAWGQDRSISDVNPESTIMALNNHKQQLEKSRFISPNLINNI